jgi:hypothetical protein
VLTRFIKIQLVLFTILTVIAITVLLIFVIPTFAAMFAEVNMTLPLPTRIVIGMSHFLKTYWWVMIGSGVGSVFAFRGRRGDRIKLLFWDGQGFCLYYKILEKGRFPWPSATDGTARLTSAQLSMLCDYAC